MDSSLQIDKGHPLREQDQGCQANALRGDLHLTIHDSVLGRDASPLAEQCNSDHFGGQGSGGSDLPYSAFHWQILRGIVVCAYYGFCSEGRVGAELTV